MDSRKEDKLRIQIFCIIVLFTIECLHLNVFNYKQKFSKTFFGHFFYNYKHSDVERWGSLVPLIESPRVLITWYLISCRSENGEKNVEFNTSRP